MNENEENVGWMKNKFQLMAKVREEFFTLLEKYWLPHKKFSMPFHPKNFQLWSEYLGPIKIHSNWCWPRNLTVKMGKRKKIERKGSQNYGDTLFHEHLAYSIEKEKNEKWFEFLCDFNCMINDILA